MNALECRYSKHIGILLLADNSTIDMERESDRGQEELFRRCQVFSDDFKRELMYVGWNFGQKLASFGHSCGSLFQIELVREFNLELGFV